MAPNKKETFAEMLSQLKSNSEIKPQPVAVIEERKYFLIVCEGTRTEPIYFEYFKHLLPKSMIDTITISGEGDNTINVVNEAINKRNLRRKNRLAPPHDEVWAVFDKDDFPNHKFDTAIAHARNNNIEPGFSNQSFELWYVLHFQFLETALHRNDYISILSDTLGFKYQKNNKEIVELLFSKGDVNQAIKWAKKLEKKHASLTPSESCPCTTIYKLVDSLLNYINNKK